MGLTALGLTTATGALTTAGAVTAGVVGAVGIGAATGAFSKSGAPKMPGAAATDKTKTAEALPQTTEAAKKNRRLSASLLTEGFAPPKLGIPGLDAFKGSANLG